MREDSCTTSQQQKFLQIKKKSNKFCTRNQYRDEIDNYVLICNTDVSLKLKTIQLLNLKFNLMKLKKMINLLGLEFNWIKLKVQS